MGVGSAEDLVTTKFGSNQLADDVTVGEADDKPVFGSIVFVLCLSNKLLSSLFILLDTG